MADRRMTNAVCSVMYESDKWFPQLQDHFRKVVNISIEMEE